MLYYGSLSQGTLFALLVAVAMLASTGKGQAQLPKVLAQRVQTWTAQVPVITSTGQATVEEARRQQFVQHNARNVKVLGRARIQEGAVPYTIGVALVVNGAMVELIALDVYLPPILLTTRTRARRTNFAQTKTLSMFQATPRTGHAHLVLMANTSL